MNNRIGNPPPKAGGPQLRETEVVEVVKVVEVVEVVELEKAKGTEGADRGERGHGERSLFANVPAETSPVVLDGTRIEHREGPRIGTYQFAGERVGPSEHHREVFTARVREPDDKGNTPVELGREGHPIEEFFLSKPDENGTMHGIARSGVSSSSREILLQLSLKGGRSELSFQETNGFGVNSTVSRFKSILEVKPPPALLTFRPGVYTLDAKFDVTSAPQWTGNALINPQQPRREAKATLTIAELPDGKPSITVQSDVLPFGSVTFKNLGPATAPPAVLGMSGGPHGEGIVCSFTPGEPPAFSMNITPGNDQQHRWQRMTLERRAPSGRAAARASRGNGGGSVDWC